MPKLVGAPGYPAIELPDRPERSDKIDDFINSYASSKQEEMKASIEAYLQDKEAQKMKAKEEVGLAAKAAASFNGAWGRMKDSGDAIVRAVLVLGALGGAGYLVAHNVEARSQEAATDTATRTASLEDEAPQEVASLSRAERETMAREAFVDWKRNKTEANWQKYQNIIRGE